MGEERHDAAPGPTREYEMFEQTDEQVSESHASKADMQPEERDAPANVAQLQAELRSAQDEAAANQDKYLRARADMDNFKRRVEQRYADEALRSKNDLLKKLLAVRDNIERALQFGGASESSGESIIEGVRLTQYQLDQVLTQEGVQAIDTQGKPFDPRTEEAIQTVDDPRVPDHTVVQEVRKGYTLGDNILRPAQVIVSVGGE